ncbi:MAG: Holliday junction DNA helicase RuvA [Chloroflexi bacterium RBG_16_48_8]|nr:MAG: Holliday junction DNA helicase RuvA [Chloroflexi bacterium RBG_16_48_8]
MIASIQGLVQHIDEGSIVVEIGGIGLRLKVPTSVLDAIPALGRTILLYTRLIVREDSLNLYGFISPEQRDLFNTLINISGIGPQLGLAILSYISPEILQSAVANKQPEALTIVPGIGQKTAEKIIFFLKDRFKIPMEGLKPASVRDNELSAVLTSLGYSMVEVQAALKSIPADSPESIEERLRLALQYFSQA